jgi:hypothetical protein
MFHFRRPSLRPLLIAVLAIVLFGGLAAVVVNNLRQPATAPPPPETVLFTTTAASPVVVAAVDVPRGAVVTPNLLETRDWRKDLVPPGSITKPEDVVGRVALAPLPKDGPVLDGHLAPKGAGRSESVPSALFGVKIDPNTPLKDLLPAAPEVRKSAGPVLAEDLARVPEVEFQAEVPVTDARLNTAILIAKINHLNGKKADGFLEALRGERPDLAGLPFAMGDECRTEGERRREFTRAVANVRGALRPRPSAPWTFATENFWGEYRAACVKEDQSLWLAGQAPNEDVTRARIAALMQVLAPESPDLRLGLARYLSGVAHHEATRALARLAIFSPDDEARQAAIEALRSRPKTDYTELLLRGLRYPWPAVARRAAEAAVKLERADLVPQLVALLDEPDPRAPVLQEVGKKTVPVVHELVRVNHHRSCLMCHAPRDTANVSSEALTAPVPVPGAPLPSPSEGYYQPSSSDLLVRVDVTYLRQDFSVYQPVADANPNPWPEMQRFDFLVRKRVLTDEEAEAYRAKLDRREPGRPSPYRRAVVAALRDLTGRDTEPTAEAWRRTLGLEATQRH